MIRFWPIFTPKYTKFWPTICRNFSLFLQYDHFCTKLHCEFCVEYKSKVSKRKEMNHLDNIRHSYSSNQAVSSSSSSSSSEEPLSSLSLSAVPRFHLFWQSSHLQKSVHPILAFEHEQASQWEVRSSTKMLQFMKLIGGQSNKREKAKGSYLYVAVVSSCCRSCYMLGLHSLLYGMVMS